MRVFSFDTETALIAPGRVAPPLACVTWATATESGIDDPDVGVRRVLDALRDPNTLVVGHNVTFDLGVIAQHSPEHLPDIFYALDAGRVACTMVQEKLRYVAARTTNPQFDLATLVDKWLGRKMSGKNQGDAWRFHYRKLIGVPVSQWPKRARDYALTDAELTLAVWEKQDRMPDLAAQVRADWALHLMGAWGLTVDAEAVYALDARIRPEVEREVAFLQGHGIYRPDGTQDRKALIEWITRAFNGNPPRNEPTAKMEAKGISEGTVKYDEKTLRASGDPVLKHLADVSKDMKELSAFLPLLLDAAKSGLPINPFWNVLVNTGRTSCRNPNAQQFPKRPGVRECFVPRPGHVFFGADYGEAEIRSLAQVLFNLFGANSLQKAINDDLSVHLLTASRILGIPYEEAVSRYNAGDPVVDEARTLSKACNFGYPGGLGASTFVTYAAGYGQTITEERGKELKQLWLETIPEMRLYFSYISRITGSGRAIIEQHYSKRIRGGVGYCDGCNTFFQGLTADGAKRALYEVVRRQMIKRTSALYGTRTNAFIHDELLAEGPEDQVPEAGEEMAQVMVEEMGVVAPDVKHEAEPYMMPRWYKKAKTVRDENGRLMLWTPSTKKKDKAA